MSSNARPTRRAAVQAQEVIKQDLARREKMTEAERAAEDEESDEDLVLEELHEGSYDDSEVLSDEEEDDDE
jgi:hypothetical protein